MEEFISNLLQIMSHFLAYGCKETHHWHIISRMDEQTVVFINEAIPKQDEETKGLSWIVIALSEPNLLARIIHKICNDGSYLDSYKDDSLLLTHKEQLLQVLETISTNNMKIEGDLSEKYEAWLTRKTANEMASEVIEITLR